MFAPKPTFLIALCCFPLASWWMPTAAFAGEDMKREKVKKIEIDSTTSDLTNGIPKATASTVAIANAISDPLTRETARAFGDQEWFKKDKYLLDRMEWELKAYKRSEFGRNLDEQRERRKYDNLSERHQLAKMFINGNNRPWTEAAYRAAMQQFESSPATAEVMQTSVPPLDEEQFVATSCFRQILNSDGSLKHAPPVLVGNSGSPLEMAQAKVADVWQETLEKVGTSSPIAYSDVAAMQDAAAEWKRLSASNCRRADSIARHHGEEYLNSLEALINTVSDPGRRELLRAYHYGTGIAFGGGTVAHLVHHVVDNDLSIRPGSTAQLILTELAHDMLRDLEAEINLADSRKEYYKAQNQQSGLNPKFYETTLSQRRPGASPGSVPTSADRLRDILYKGETQASALGDKVAKHVIY